MNIEISKEYKESLIPISKEILEPLDIPKETFQFLTEIGLPLHTECEITPNAPIQFCKYPTIKKYPYLQHRYLHIASFDVMGEIAINLHYQSVHQIQVENNRGNDTVSFFSLMNHSVGQFIDCLGLWMSFYPQFRKEIMKKLEIDPEFSLFDFEHEKMYDDILQKLKEVDPKSMREKKFFWRRMCEPDII